jgi:hypothetical protein
MSDAKINKEYLLRMLGVALFMVVVTLWSLYDGLVAWPRVNDEYAQARPALLATNLTAKAWLAPTGAGGVTPVERIFAAQNLKTPKKLIRRINEAKSPENLSADELAPFRERERRFLRNIFEEPLYSPGDLQGQFVMAAIAAVAAFLIGVAVIPKVKRCYHSDDQGVHCSVFNPPLLSYADIESIDWKLWDKKGIVKLNSKEGSRHTLDSWHFNGIKEIVADIIEHRPDLNVDKG